jgi:chemotaxis protein methyltransferase CheR
MERDMEQNTSNRPIGLSVMSEGDFNRLSQFIYKVCGIKLTSVKKVMVESRLSKRLRELDMKKFSEYCDYLFSDRGMEEELVHMIDIVTTNKTDFFREPGHFDYLINKAIPELIRQHDAGIRRKLRVWSAGCSTGEEPYTLAMVLKEYAENCRGFDFEIMATDISTRVLQTASLAIYEEEKVMPVPPQMKRKYLLRGKGGRQGRVRITPELRETIRFRRLNFMDEDFGIKERMDVIFCRNVIIYFDRTTQERLLRRFCDHLVPGGYVFMGHSETLNGMDVPLISVAPTTYRKKS